MGTKLLYYVILLPISKLPYPLLYLFSNFLYFLLYILSGYRKKVVFKNLKKSFPDKSEKELKGIMSQFFKHLCDVIVESIKGFTISERQLKKRLIIRKRTNS